jgi:hypothetical protein
MAIIASKLKARKLHTFGNQTEPTEYVASVNDNLPDTSGNVKLGNGNSLVSINGKEVQPGGIMTVPLVNKINNTEAGDDHKLTFEFTSIDEKTFTVEEDLTKNALGVLGFKLKAAEQKISAADETITVEGDTGSQTVKLNLDGRTLVKKTEGTPAETHVAVNIDGESIVYDEDKGWIKSVSSTNVVVPMNETIVVDTSVVFSTAVGVNVDDETLKLKETGTEPGEKKLAVAIDGKTLKYTTTTTDQTNLVRVNIDDSTLKYDEGTQKLKAVFPPDIDTGITKIHSDTLFIQPVEEGSREVNATLLVQTEKGLIFKDDGRGNQILQVNADNASIGFSSDSEEHEMYVKLDSTSITSSANGLKVNIDNSSIQNNNGLKVGLIDGTIKLDNTSATKGIYVPIDGKTIQMVEGTTAGVKDKVGVPIDGQTIQYDTTNHWLFASGQGVQSVEPGDGSITIDPKKDATSTFVFSANLGEGLYADSRSGAINLNLDPASMGITLVGDQPAIACTALVRDDHNFYTLISGLNPTLESMEYIIGGNSVFEIGDSAAHNGDVHIDFGKRIFTGSLTIQFKVEFLLNGVLYIKGAMGLIIVNDLHSYGIVINDDGTGNGATRVIMHNFALQEEPDHKIELSACEMTFDESCAMTNIRTSIMMFKEAVCYLNALYKIPNQVEPYNKIAVLTDHSKIYITSNKATAPVNASIENFATPDLSGTAVVDGVMFLPDVWIGPRKDITKTIHSISDLVSIVEALPDKIQVDYTIQIANAADEVSTLDVVLSDRFYGEGSITIKSVNFVLIHSIKIHSRIPITMSNICPRDDVEGKNAKGILTEVSPNPLRGSDYYMNVKLTGLMPMIKEEVVPLKHCYYYSSFRGKNTEVFLDFIKPSSYYVLPDPYTTVVQDVVLNMQVYDGALVEIKDAGTFWDGYSVEGFVPQVATVYNGGELKLWDKFVAGVGNCTFKVNRCGRMSFGHATNTMVLTDDLTILSDTAPTKTRRTK